MKKAWAEADANGDGRLDLQEYIAFNNATRTMQMADGHWVEANSNSEL